MSEPQSLHIITVHGTWARGKFRNRSAAELAAAAKKAKVSIPWFCEGSKFLSRLQIELAKQEVPTTAEAFEWSGANTLAARAEASQALAQHLRSCRQPVLLVAHNHGGNAALAALQDEEVPPLSLVTLATPFIKLHKREHYDIIDHIAAGLGFALGPFVFLLLSWRVLDFFNLVKPGGWLELIVMLTTVASIPTAIVALRVFPHRAKNSTDDALRSLVCELPSRHALLTLRGYDDEAALAIAFGAATSFLARVIESGLRKLLLFVLMLIGLWVGVAKVALDKSWVDWGADFLFAFWVIGLSAVVMVTPMIYRAARTFFGREFLWLGTDVAAVVHSAPDHEGTAQLLTLEKSEGSQRGLNHALYNHPAAVPEITKWLTAHVNLGA